MALPLIGLVIAVGFVLLLSRRGGRRERRRPPHLSSALLERGPVVQDGRVRRLLAWMRHPSTEADDRYRRWLSSGGGFGGFGCFGGFGDGGGGGCGGDGGC